MNSKWISLFLWKTLSWAHRLHLSASSKYVKSFLSSKFMFYYYLYQGCPSCPIGQQSIAKRLLQVGDFSGLHTPTVFSLTYNHNIWSPVRIRVYKYAGHSCHFHSVQLCASTDGQLCSSQVPDSCPTGSPVSSPTPQPSSSCIFTAASCTSGRFFEIFYVAFTCYFFAVRCLVLLWLLQ